MEYTCNIITVLAWVAGNFWQRKSLVYTYAVIITYRPPPQKDHNKVVKLIIKLYKYFFPYNQCRYQYPSKPPINLCICVEMSY